MMNRYGLIARGWGVSKDIIFVLPNITLEINNPLLLHKKNLVFNFGFLVFYAMIAFGEEKKE